MYKFWSVASFPENVTIFDDTEQNKISSPANSIAVETSKLFEEFAQKYQNIWTLDDLQNFWWTFIGCHKIDTR